MGTRTDHPLETATPDSWTNTFAWLKSPKQRPRRKAKKREALLGHSETGFRGTALVTAGRFDRDSLVRDLKLAFRRLFIGNHESLENPLWGDILSGFPTTTAADRLLDRPVETPIQERSRNRTGAIWRCHVMIFRYPFHGPLSTFTAPDV